MEEVIKDVCMWKWFSEDVNCYFIIYEDFCRIMNTSIDEFITPIEDKWRLIIKKLLFEFEFISPAYAYFYILELYVLARNCIVDKQTIKNICKYERERILQKWTMELEVL
jgi:hypothetical protein